MNRAEVVEMHRRMREVRDEMNARERVPNVVDNEATNMRVQAEIAMEAMERMVAVMDNEPGVIPKDMR